jgi:hypothetical protein
MNRIAFAFALTLAAAPALAQDVVPPQPELTGSLSVYSEYDQNGDGQVTMAEVVALVPAELAGAVKACDRDANGLLAEEEYDRCQYGEPTGDVKPAPTR